MAWLKGVGERTFLVEDDGTHWDTAKRVQYDPKTLKPMGGKKATIEEEDVPCMNETDRRKQLYDMKWGKLRKLHKSITGKDERSMKKDEIIAGIIEQESR